VNTAELLSPFELAVVSRRMGERGGVCYRDVAGPGQLLVRRVVQRLIDEVERRPVDYCGPLTRERQSRDVDAAIDYGSRAMSARLLPNSHRLTMVPELGTEWITDIDGLPPP
jgi:hypothetical protein